MRVLVFFDLPVITGENKIQKISSKEWISYAAGISVL